MIACRFQWVNLQITNLNGMKLEEDIVENLGKLPKSLVGSYAQILDSMRDGTPREWELTKKALMWIMCSRTLLTPAKWCEVAYWPTTVPENGSDILFELCRNLVTSDTESEVVRFVHLSVHECLEGTFDSVDSNSMAAVCCLSVLSQESEIEQKVTDSTAAESSPIGPELSGYSTHYWTEHVERSHSVDKPMSRLLLDGLRCFMGTTTRPAIPYTTWLGRTRTGIARPLTTHPINILPALSYFSFGGHPELWQGVETHMNCANGGQQTLLHLASTSGNQVAVRILLEHGADFDRLDIFDRTPLLVAMNYGQTMIALQLLDNGAKLPGCANAFEAVAKSGDVSMFHALMDRDHDLMITEALVRAAAGNLKHSVDLLKLLFSIDPNIKFTEAILIAVAKGGNKYIMEGLLSSDYDLEISEAVVVATVQWSDHMVTSGGLFGIGITGLLGALLDRNPNTEITDAVIIGAAKNSTSSDALIRFFHCREPTMRITDSSLTDMLSSLLRSEICGMGHATLKRLVDDRQITE